MSCGHFKLAPPEYTLLDSCPRRAHIHLAGQQRFEMVSQSEQLEIANETAKLDQLCLQVVVIPN